LAKLRQAGESGTLNYSTIEQRWLDRLSKAADALPENEDTFIDQMIAQIDREKIHLDQYDLALR
jgi:hypothetical protein